MALVSQTLLVSAHLLHAAFVVEVAVGACDPEFGSGSKRVYSADCSPEKNAVAPLLGVEAFSAD